MSKLKTLQDKRGELAAKIREFSDRQESWTPEDRANYAAVNKDYDANLTELQAAIEADKAARAEAVEVVNRADAIDGYQDYSPADARIGRDGGKPGERSNADNRSLALQAFFGSGGAVNLTNRHREACAAVGFDINAKVLDFNLMPTPQIQALTRCVNMSHPSVREQRLDALLGSSRFRNDLSAFTGSEGAFTIPEGFITSLEVNMLAFGGMRQVSDIIRTSGGEALPWPTVDDTGNTGEQLGESADIGDSVDPTFAQVIWYAHKFSSKLLKIPSELLQDSAFNLPALVGSMLGERLGRITNTRFTTGTGVGTPKGLTVAATTGVTSAASASIAADELFDLEHSVDPAYRDGPGVGYMFHDDTLLHLRKKKDGEGRYLWQAGFNTGAPDTINARPYTINQDMASTLESGAISMLFGNLKAYKIRQVGSMRLKRLDELYAADDQVAFIAFVREDGNLLEAGTPPVKSLVQV